MIERCGVTDAAGAAEFDVAEAGGGKAGGAATAQEDLEKATQGTREALQ